MTAVTPFVYGGFFVQALLCRLLRSKRGGVVGAAVGSSLAFFVLSNFSVWAAGYYSRTAEGLVACYVAGLPFLTGTLIGDLVWTLVLSTVYRLAAARLEPSPRWVPVPTKELAVV